MPVSQVTITTPVPEVIFTESSLGAVVDSVTTSNGILYYIFVDNSLNLLVPSYVKLYFDIPSNITVGATLPNDILFVAPGAKETRKYLTEAAFGKIFPTALSVACVVSPGAAGTTSPTNPVYVKISYMSLSFPPSPPPPVI
jgi:hypothetical protein